MILATIQSIFTAVLFSSIGIAMFVVALRIFDRITPGNFWRELLEEDNVALAIVVGAVALGISTIVAAAIHG